MKITYLLAALLLLPINACCTGRMLTMSDYKKMPENEIRNQFLQHTPIGCTKEITDNFIKKGLCKDYRVFNFGMVLAPRGEYICKIEDGDTTYEVYLANYGVLQRLFLGGYIVYGYWLFNKDGKLKDVQVIRYFEGI